MSKTILVTGASRGIGRAVALLAGARGWSVGVNYAGNREAAEKTVGDVVAAGGKALAIAGDISREADVVAMFDAVTAAFGPLDGVVANAGIVGEKQALIDMESGRLERMFAVNTLGAFLTAREAARRMARSRGGKGGSLDKTKNPEIDDELAQLKKKIRIG